MDTIVKNIFDIKKSKPFIEYNNYHKDNIFGITKTSRWELMHSNFIAWLLSSDESHSLGNYTISQFIKTCYLIKDKPENMQARLDESMLPYYTSEGFIIGTSRVEREYPCNKRSIDILIEVGLSNGKKLPIIIENKVESKEGKNQTIDYFNFGEEVYKDRAIYLEPIYVYLSPQYNKDLPEQKEYILFRYQDLVDNVLEPALWNAGDSDTSRNIRMYLQCLSFQTDNEKGDRTMAISSEEKRIIDDFIKQNKNLLTAVINELDGISDNTKNKVIGSVRNYSDYMFNNQRYGKAKLVKAVVEKYVDDKQPADFKELQRAFPDKLQGSKGVIKKLEDISDKDKGLGGQKRFFVDEPIKLNSGESICVCNQWGGVERMDRFIEHVKSLGYTIIPL